MSFITQTNVMIMQVLVYVLLCSIHFAISQLCMIIEVGTLYFVFIIKPKNNFFLNLACRKQFSTM